MNVEKQKQQINAEDLLDFLLRYAILQRGIGVQSSRIVRNTTRIAEVYGYDVTVMMFQRNLGITLWASENGKPIRKTLPITAMTHHGAMPVNFNFNAELTRLSWFIYKYKPEIEEIEAKFQKICDINRPKTWLKTLVISSSNASFCFILGGDWKGMLIVFLATCCGFFVKHNLEKREAYHYFIVIVTAFVTSFLIALAGFRWGLTEHPVEALSSSVLYLIPGVPFITSIMDFFDGFFLNGMSRFLHALFIVVSIAIGLSITFITLGITL